MNHHTIALSPLARGLIARGLALVVLGCVVLAWPDPSVRIVLALSALSLVLISVFDVGHAVGSRRLVPQWWLFALRGVAGVALGALLLVAPFAPVLVIGIALAAWLGLQGMALLDAALLSAPRRRPPLLLAGLACFIPTIAAISWPAPTMLAVLYVALGYAILAGAVDIGIGLWMVITHRTHRASFRHARAA